MLVGSEAAGQHAAYCLLSAVNVILQVLSLGQLPHELTFLLLQGELEGNERVTGTIRGVSFKKPLYVKKTFSPQFL